MVCCSGRSRPSDEGGGGGRGGQSPKNIFFSPSGLILVKK